MTGPSAPLPQRAACHVDRTAIMEGEKLFSYGDLAEAASRVARSLLAGRPDLEEARIAFLVPPGFDHVAVQWGIWRAGGIAVPLAISHPPAELDHVMCDADVTAVVADPAFAEILFPLAGALGARFVTTPELVEAGATRLPEVSAERRALMLYTSGTTGKPKGVVSTHAILAAQIASLVTAWEWTSNDRALLVLPLHHVHGIVNVVGCALWAGACCEMQPCFDAEAAWQRLSSGEVTVFSAVPTIYRRLITSWEAAPPAVQRRRSEGCRKIRLMMSGSAALPLQTLERWKQITGQVLLERYGMTEIGMALSNPLHGERRPGSVGTPLPGFVLRLVDEQGTEVPAGTAGEVEVRGPTVFLEYWRRPEATRAAFRDGWFRTGDVAVIEDGVYRILGRLDIDIIKTGGFKVSALEIEEVLRMHPAVAECAVIGVDDPEWGERVCAAIEARDEGLSLDELQRWAKARLAPYKVPKALCRVRALPRNAMGKVVKPEVAALFTPGRAQR